MLKVKVKKQLTICKELHRVTNRYTVKPVYNDHPRDPEIVVIVERWSLFRGQLCDKNIKPGPQKGGCYLKVVVNSGLTVLTNKHIL